MVTGAKIGVNLHREFHLLYEFCDEFRFLELGVVLEYVHCHVSSLSCDFRGDLFMGYRMFLFLFHLCFCVLAGDANVRGERDSE